MKKLFQLVLSGFVLAGIVIAKWDIDENAETTNGGKITVTTTDDGINASRDGSATVEINGGNAVLAFTIPGIFGRSASSNYVMILSSPKIIAGTNYNVKSGVTVSVTEDHRKAHFQIQDDKI